MLLKDHYFAIYLSKLTFSLLSINNLTLQILFENSYLEHQPQHLSKLSVDRKSDQSIVFKFSTGVYSYAIHFTDYIKLFNY